MMSPVKRCDCGDILEFSDMDGPCPECDYTSADLTPRSPDTFRRRGLTRSKRDRREEAWEAGVRQAIAWLRADYEFGTGPDWREDGAEWIAQRLAEHRQDGGAAAS